jgi:hypothetical protein
MLFFMLILLRKLKRNARVSVPVLDEYGNGGDASEPCDDLKISRTPQYSSIAAARTQPCNSSGKRSRVLLLGASLDAANNAHPVRLFDQEGMDSQMKKIYLTLVLTLAIGATAAIISPSLSASSTSTPIVSALQNENGNMNNNSRGRGRGRNRNHNNNGNSNTASH